MGSDSDNQDRVGYGRPPPEHQFQKGRSGNPSGSRRRRSSSNNQADFRTALMEAFQKVGVATVKGRKRRLPMAEILGMRLMADAIQGDGKARDQVLKYAERFGKDAPASAATSEEDELILELFGQWIIEKLQSNK